MNIKTECRDTENKILFAIFKYKEEVFAQINERLGEEYFVFPENKKIYKNLKKYILETQTYPSHVSFLNLLCNMPDTQEEDKLKYKNEMERISKAVCLVNDVGLLCDILIKLHAVRKLCKSLKNNVEKLGQTEVTEVITKIHEDIITIKNDLTKTNKVQSLSFVKDFKTRLEYAEDVYKTPEKIGMVRTGIEHFDKHMRPIAPGQLLIYGARPGVGKSVFLMTSAIYNYEVLKLETIIITLEMTAIEYAFRMDSNITGIYHDDFFNGVVLSEDYKQKWQTRVTNFYNGKSDLIVYFCPNATPAKIEAIIQTTPFKPKLVVIDYSNIIKIPGYKGIPDTDVRLQGQIFTELKRIAQNNDCVVFTAQQLIRGSVAKGVTLESGKYSGKSEEDADFWISIEPVYAVRDEDVRNLDITDPDKTLYLKMRKARTAKGGDKEGLVALVRKFYAKMGWQCHKQDPNEVLKQKEIEEEKRFKEEKSNEDEIPDLEHNEYIENVL